MAKKDNGSIKLPKAWQSMKHRNETAQARSDFEGLWGAIGAILAILLGAFILLGGISQTGLIRFLFDWGNKTSNTVANWIGGGGVIVNDDGIYIDPSGQTGQKLYDPHTEENTEGDEIEETPIEEPIDESTEDINEETINENAE